MRQLLRYLLDHSLLLVFGATTAFVWANTHFTSYDRIAHHLHVPINDVGMAFFFALAAKEVFEATLAGGAFSSPRRAAVPLVAAAGGMAVPAALYVGLVFWSGERQLLRGWAIPCATDIAFSAMVARTIFRSGHPAVPFLLLLAIADDALGLVILALFYPMGQLRPLEFAVLMTLSLASAWSLRMRGVRSFWPYVGLAGGLSWLALYRGGFHPSLALVPVIPFLHGAGQPPSRESKAAQGTSFHDPVDALIDFEQRAQTPVQFVLLLFGLANAGVPFASTGPGTWIVLAAILLGKPLGVLLLTALSALAGLRRPSGLGWGDLAVVGCAAGIGFTVALFFATAAFPEGVALAETKMGALLSFGAAGLALAVAVTARVGRFARR